MVNCDGRCSDMRSQIPWPLKKVLRETSPEPAALERMWVEVDRRGRSSKGARVWRPLIAAAVLGLVLIAVRTRSRQSVPSAFLEHGRTQIGILEQPKSAAGNKDLVFESGSRIAVLPGGRLEALENDSQRLDLLLR